MRASRARSAFARFGDRPLAERRARVGLQRLEEYMKGLEAMYRVKVEPGASPPAPTKQKP